MREIRVVRQVPRVMRLLCRSMSRGNWYRGAVSAWRLILATLVVGVSSEQDLWETTCWGGVGGRTILILGRTGGKVKGEDGWDKGFLRVMSGVRLFSPGIVANGLMTALRLFSLNNDLV